MLDSEPGQGQNAPAGTTQIITNYSEAVEIGFSELKVYDANGNQVDNKDTAYNGGETSLIVTTPPLEDGVYTITSKVLSKIDGHLVQAAIVFGVGDVKIDSSLLEKQENSETTFIPESIARFPGLVGQTIVLGGVIVSITIWSSQQTRFREVFADINEQFKIKFSKIIGIGVIATFASNFIMLGVQTWRLETSPLDVIGTTFGTTWLIRMIITIIIIGLWFWMEKKNEITIKGQIPLLIASLILIATTTMMGHGASTELEAMDFRLFTQFVIFHMDWRSDIFCICCITNNYKDREFNKRENYTKFDSKILRIIHYRNWNFNHNRSNVTMVLR